MHRFRVYTRPTTGFHLIGSLRKRTHYLSSLFPYFIVYTADTRFSKISLIYIFTYAYILDACVHACNHACAFMQACTHPGIDTYMYTCMHIGRQTRLWCHANKINWYPIAFWQLSCNWQFIFAWSFIKESWRHGCGAWRNSVPNNLHYGDAAIPLWL